MRSLRYRLLLVIILAIIFNSSIMVAAAFWGGGKSRMEWREMVSTQSINRLALVVEALWLEHGELTLSGSRESMNQITLFTDELATFAIYNAEKTPIYYWRNQAYPGLSPTHSLKPQYAVLHKGEIIGWVSCLPSDFYFISTNRSLVIHMIQTLILGIALSVAAAIAVSHRMSLKATRDARVLAALLGKLSRGERNIPFPEQSTIEFQAIARASARLQNTLIKEERQRRQWTQDIAHDLKTPVTALRGQLEAIHDGVLELSEERFKTLEGEFTHIDKLVQDLSLLSQVESPEMVPVIRKMDAASFLAQIKSRFTPVAQAAGLKLACSQNPEKNLTILADPNLLARAVNNLVQNAIQHTRSASSGTITVQLTAEGDVIALTVENPGRIPESNLPYLFERLYRGDSGRSTPGSGLGLTIVKAVADKLGGSVTGRNTSRGTVRMRLILPRRGKKPL
ncbi:MAG: HAMP domain-containing histidine kinase [Spirochaetaceae bacterium]|nr:HAMP domain-containing histidine kinase [Spirochaetaceae bacterium]